MAEGRGQEDGTPKRGRGQEDGAQNPAVGCERGQGHLSPPQFPNSLPPFLSHCASPSPPPPASLLDCYWPPGAGMASTCLS